MASSTVAAASSITTHNRAAASRHGGSSGGRGRALALARRAGGSARRPSTFARPGISLAKESGTGAEAREGRAESRRRAPVAPATRAESTNPSSLVAGGSSRNWDSRAPRTRGPLAPESKARNGLRLSFAFPDAATAASHRPRAPMPRALSRPFCFPLGSISSPLVFSLAHRVEAAGVTADRASRHRRETRTNAAAQ